MGQNGVRGVPVSEKERVPPSPESSHTRFIKVGRVKKQTAAFFPKSSPKNYRYRRAKEGGQQEEEGGGWPSLTCLAGRRVITPGGGVPQVQPAECLGA